MTNPQRILAALADGPKPIKYLDDLIQANAYTAIKQLERHGCVRRKWHDRVVTVYPQKKRFIYLIEATGKPYKPYGRAA